MNVNVLGDLEEKCGNCDGLSPKYVTDYGLIAGIGQLWTFPIFGNGKIA
jgi:hypothetical protein